MFGIVVTESNLELEEALKPLILMKPVSCGLDHFPEIYQLAAKALSIET